MMRGRGKNPGNRKRKGASRCESRGAIATKKSALSGFKKTKKSTVKAGSRSQCCGKDRQAPGIAKGLGGQKKGGDLGKIGGKGLGFFCVWWFGFFFVCVLGVGGVLGGGGLGLGGVVVFLVLGFLLGLGGGGGVGVFWLCVLGFLCFLVIFFFFVFFWWFGVGFLGFGGGGGLGPLFIWGLFFFFVSK